MWLTGTGKPSSAGTGQDRGTLVNIMKKNSIWVCPEKGYTKTAIQILCITYDMYIHIYILYIINIYILYIYIIYYIYIFILHNTF